MFQTTNQYINQKVRMKLDLHTFSIAKFNMLEFQSAQLLKQSICFQRFLNFSQHP